MTLTLSDIDAAEAAVKNVRAKLEQLGRAIYQMRNGEKLGSEYGFDRYQRQTYAGDHYDGQEGPDWGKGAPIFSLRYYWSRAEREIVVTLPQGWIEQDWAALEAERLSEERAEIAQRERAEVEQQKLAQQRSELETYERLKAKFGEAPPHPQGAK